MKESLRTRWLATAAITFAAIALMSACGEGGTDATVRLDDRVDVAAVSTSPEPTRVSGTLRIAIAGVMSPSRTIDAYDELVSYLERELGMAVSVDQRSSYAEVNDLLRTGQADIAFVCSRAYLEGQEQFGMELLLAPQVNGDISYYSYLIVPSDSAASSLADLRGARFAFSDPLSNSGKLVPEFQLHLAGETPSSFFSAHEYTGSHDNSIMAVADRLVDGAAVDSLVYEYVVERSPEIGERTKVIARWGPYGIPPVVASASLPAGSKEQVRSALLEMDGTEDGLAALAELGVERFVLVDDAAYDSIREMLMVLREAGR